MTGLMMKDALVMRKTLRLYALFLLFYSGLAVQIGRASCRERV